MFAQMSRYEPAAAAPIRYHVSGDKCPVRSMCLAYAVAAEEPFGIWGGLDPQKRRALPRRLLRRNTGAAAATGISA